MITAIELDLGLGPCGLKWTRDPVRLASHSIISPEFTIHIYVPQ